MEEKKEDEKNLINGENKQEYDENLVNNHEDNKINYPDNDDNEENNNIQENLNKNNKKEEEDQLNNNNNINKILTNGEYQLPIIENNLNNNIINENINNNNIDNNINNNINQNNNFAFQFNAPKIVKNFFDFEPNLSAEHKEEQIEKKLTELLFINLYDYLNIFI